MGICYGGGAPICYQCLELFKMRQNCQNSLYELLLWLQQVDSPTFQRENKCTQRFDGPKEPRCFEKNQNDKKLVFKLTNKSLDCIKKVPYSLFTQISNSSRLHDYSLLKNMISSCAWSGPRILVMLKRSKYYKNISAPNCTQLFMTSIVKEIKSRQRQLNCLTK